MAKYSSKINKIRTFALSLIFIGFIVMYLGLFFKTTSCCHDDFHGAGPFIHNRKHRGLFLDWNAFYKIDPGCLP